MTKFRIAGVLAAGAGGTATYALAAIDRVVYHHNKDAYLIVGDGDVIEDRNLERQDFKASDVKRNKAEVLAEGRLLSTDAFPKYIDSVECWVDLLHDTARRIKDPDSECIVVCSFVDNDATRKDMYEAIPQVPYNVLVIDPGNDFNNGGIDVNFHAWQLKKWLLQGVWKRHPQILKPRDRKPGPDCMVQAVASPQLITANMMGGLLTVQMVVNWITGKPVHSSIWWSLKPDGYGMVASDTYLSPPTDETPSDEEE